MAWILGRSRFSDGAVKSHPTVSQAGGPAQGAFGMPAEQARNFPLDRQGIEACIPRMVCHFPWKSINDSARNRRSSSINLTLQMDGSRLVERAISTGRQALNKPDSSTLWDAGVQFTIDEILALVELPG